MKRGSPSIPTDLPSQPGHNRVRPQERGWRGGVSDPQDPTPIGTPGSHMKMEMKREVVSRTMRCERRGAGSAQVHVADRRGSWEARLHQKDDGRWEGKRCSGQDGVETIGRKGRLHPVDAHVTHQHPLPPPETTSTSENGHHGIDRMDRFSPKLPCTALEWPEGRAPRSRSASMPTETNARNRHLRGAKRHANGKVDGKRKHASLRGRWRGTCAGRAPPDLPRRTGPMRDRPARETSRCDPSVGQRRSHVVRIRVIGPMQGMLLSRPAALRKRTVRCDEAASWWPTTRRIQVHLFASNTRPSPGVRSPRPMHRPHTRDSGGRMRETDRQNGMRWPW